MKIMKHYPMKNGIKCLIDLPRPTFQAHSKKNVKQQRLMNSKKNYSKIHK